MPKCGSQFWLCDLPIRFDTYKGCTHNCKYCFTQKKNGNLTQVKTGESAKALKAFIDGKRNLDTAWCDWGIPVHFGGTSDPFQPAEQKHKRTLEALKVFAEARYPVVISTKGRLCIEDEWLDVLKRCNVVMQISMVCDKYDILEGGCPTFRERLHMVEVLSKNVRRVIVRMQPYMREVLPDVINVLPEIKEAGAYGVILEGMKFVKKKRGFVKVGGDWCYPIDGLRADFVKIRSTCRSLGLAFFSGENRLRSMGDSLTCCGVADIEGFEPNTYNLNHICKGEKISPRAQMMRSGTGLGVTHGLEQEAGTRTNCKDMSFVEAMKRVAAKAVTKEAFGIR